MDSKRDDLWDERGKHGERGERSVRRWDEHGDATSDSLRVQPPTEEAAGGAVLVPRSARRWAISLTLLAALIGSLGGAYWTSSSHQAALDEAVRGPITRPTTANPPAASSQPADTTQSSGTPAGQSAAAALPGEMPMSGRYPIGPDGKLLRPKDAPLPEVPRLPDNAQFETPEGADAFNRYFIDLIPYTWITTDTQPLENITLPDCDWCQNLVDHTSRSKNQGGWLEEASVQMIATTDPILVTPDEHMWRAEYTLEVGPLHSYNGNEFSTQDTYTNTLIMLSQFTEDGWRVYTVAVKELLP